MLAGVVAFSWTVPKEKAKMKCCVEGGYQQCIENYHWATHVELSLPWNNSLLCRPNSEAKLSIEILAVQVSVRTHLYAFTKFW
jgi:hypothetical protein